MLDFVTYARPENADFAILGMDKYAYYCKKRVSDLSDDQFPKYLYEGDMSDEILVIYNAAGQLMMLCDVNNHWSLFEHMSDHGVQMMLLN